MAPAGLSRLRPTVSYDLMVFDPPAAPRELAAFLAWWKQQSAWSESHGYQDPGVTTPQLRAWFQDVAASFPPMNGPLAVDEPDDESATDYSIGRQVIYAAFAWSRAADAYQRVFAAAKKHGVGFFDASGEGGEVWLPDASGELVLAFRG